MDRARPGLNRDPQAGRWSARRRALLAHGWVVYAKTPMGGPAQVLEYLSRYTHRTAISNERILGIQAGQVKLRVRADQHGAKRVIRIPGEQFVQRFMQHVLPQGFKRIRHYGLLAPAHKSQLLASARAALGALAPDPVAIESARAFMQRVAKIDILRCPACRLGTLHLVLIVLPTAARRADAIPLARGPP